MGMHQHVYLGAYLVVPHAPQSHAIEAYECSANPRHRASKQDRFCRDCGAPILRKDKLETTVSAVRCHRVKQGEFEDDFWSPESPRSDRMSLWLPNTNGFGKLMDEDLAVEQLEDLDGQYLAQCKQRLVERYAPLLAALSDELGVTAKVQAGVVVYWS